MEIASNLTKMTTLSVVNFYFFIFFCTLNPFLSFNLFNKNFDWRRNHIQYKKWMQKRIKSPLATLLCALTIDTYLPIYFLYILVYSPWNLINEMNSMKQIILEIQQATISTIEIWELIILSFLVCCWNFLSKCKGIFAMIPTQRQGIVIQFFCAKVFILFSACIAQFADLTLSHSYSTRHQWLRKVF